MAIWNGFDRLSHPYGFSFSYREVSTLLLYNPQNAKGWKSLETFGFM